MDPFLDKNHNLFIDNFYTGVKLLQDLETRSTYTCGTIRRDRGVFPPEFQQKELQRGEAVYLQSGNLVAVHWKDKRDVFCLSTIHGTADSLQGSDRPWKTWRIGLF